ncbi:hypothetical protein Chor_004079 [Crotalus horridus]
MSPRDDPDGNIDLKFEHEFSGNNSQNKYRKALKFDMKMTPVVEKLGFRPAHSGSKETEKSLSACISRQLDQYGRQYCSEKNFMHNTPVVSVNSNYRLLIIPLRLKTDEVLIITKL